MSTQIKFARQCTDLLTKINNNPIIILIHSLVIAGFVFISRNLSLKNKIQGECQGISYTKLIVSIEISFRHESH